VKAVLTNQFNKVALGDCCEIISGSTPSRNKAEFWDGEIDWFTPKDLSRIKSKYISEAPEKITALGLKSCSTTLLPKNTLLLSSRAPIGHIAITTIEACTNQGFKSLVPNKNLYVEYLFYAIKNIIPQLKDMGNGATFKEISKSTLSKVEIPLPQMTEQKQIAAILDAADSLRQKDQQLVEHYTALSQSLFLEMFGDVFLNIKHYPKATFRQLLDKVQIGPFGSQLHKHDYVENGVPLINPVHIVESKVLPSNSFSILKEKYDSLPNYHLKKGDLIMARRGEMGRCALITRKEEGFFCGTGSLYLRPNNNVNSTYLLHVITSDSGKSYLERNAQGVTMMNLNKKIILNIEIGLPPIELQNQFEVSINLIEQQKQQAQANLEKSEALFNSLLQRAFTGELTADKAA
jgi:type I restriction enzyme S subunit|tara:strand:- start:7247 stop:8461 length:1215 start_codon:yes stop_codon:yes gene_type:complete